MAGGDLVAAGGCDSSELPLRAVSSSSVPVLGCGHGSPALHSPRHLLDVVGR